MMTNLSKQDFIDIYRGFDDKQIAHEHEMLKRRKSADQDSHANALAALEDIAQTRGIKL